MNKHSPVDLVTDHAVLRYLERVLEIDVHSVRRHIASETSPAVCVGADAMSKGGLRYIFKGGKVITVLLSNKKMERLKTLKAGGKHV